MAQPNLKDTIEQLVRREDLSVEQAQQAVEAVINGADSNQCAALLVLLRSKGETPQEVAGMVKAMRKHMIPVQLEGTTIDIVGTGGDGANTLNFSTAASVVAASCGARVAKVRRRSR
jgi:anthranilate phosphoribosyltransferase